MIPIEELLNKVKWDKKESPEDYVLLYYDRVENTLKEIPLTQVEVEEGFMKTGIDGKEISIPLHRIKEVKKKGETIWKRPNTQESD